MIDQRYTTHKFSIWGDGRRRAYRNRLDIRRRKPLVGFLLRFSERFIEMFVLARKADQPIRLCHCAHALFLLLLAAMPSKKVGHVGYRSIKSL